MKWWRRHAFELAAVALYVLLLLAAARLVRDALVRLTATKDAIPALAAAITLTGVLITAGVTLVGLLLRQSIDLRTTRLAEEANQRAVIDQKRLNMQAAMETVRVLATNDGRPSPPIQTSAALIVLGKLDEIDLALVLAAEMWPRDEVSTSSVVAICDLAFETNDSALHRSSALLIFNNWQKLEVDSAQVSWPSTLTSWPDHLDDQARELLARALEAWVKKTPPVTPTDFRLPLIGAANRVGRVSLAT